MKQWVIVGLIVVGGYTVFQWFTRRQHTGVGQGAHNDQFGFDVSVKLGAVDGGSTLISGIPKFNTTPVEAGHGDQLAASQHSNALATTTGGMVYQPAFGPTVNTPATAGGTETW